MKFREYIFRRITELNCRFVFGVPGYYIMPLWQSFTQKSPKMVLATHEASAVFMADGWWRSHRKNVAFVFVTLGPGLTNAVTGIASAYRDSIPIILISGQARTSDISTGCFQECSHSYPRSFSPVNLFKNITKASFEIISPKEAVPLFEKALSVAMTGRKGPVHISIPLDIQDAEICSSFHSNHTIKSLKEIPLLNKSIKLINDSLRPLILIGGGVFLSESEQLSQDLAVKLNAPIITTIKGLSSIETETKNFVGHIGHASNPNVTDFLARYNPDLLIVLGASLSSFYFSSISHLIQNACILNINIDKKVKKVRNNDLFIYADVNLFLRKIIPLISVKKTKLLHYYPYQYTISKSDIMAQCISILNENIPRNTVVIPDAGNHWLDTLSLYKPKNINGFFTNTGLAAMAHAIGFAIGLAFNKTKRVICVTGDGSFLMGGNELLSVKENNLNLVMIVFNNQTLGRIRIAQKQNFNGNYVATDIGNVNFSKIATAFSISSYRVKTISTFARALKKALSQNEPALIEVLTNSNEIPICIKDK